MTEEIIRPAGRFLGAGVGEDAALQIAGFGLDATCSYRPGTRAGPGGIRAASDGIEEYDPVFDRSLEEVSFADRGDLVIPYGNPARALEIAAGYYDAAAASGRFVLTLGGEHLVTLAPVHSLLRRLPDLVVVQLDAHADLRESYLGERLSHACVMRRILDAGLDPDGLFQLGVRSGTREEFRAARHLDPEPSAARDVIAAVGRRPVYLTVDIDVADPAAAPGTGTPEPGGWSARELLETVARLCALRLVGADIVEVSPPVDPGGITQILAAKLAREVIVSRPPSTRM